MGLLIDSMQRLDKPVAQQPVPQRHEAGPIDKVIGGVIFLALILAAYGVWRLVKKLFRSARSYLYIDNS